MKVLIIGASHGNEVLGTKLYTRLLETRSPLLEHIDFIIGNPRAFAANQRFIESDINRSYTNKNNSYEARRAQEIRAYVEQSQPDIVLDMHTTTCDQSNCLIVSSDIGSSAMKRFLGASHISKLLQVQPLGDILSLGSFVVGYEVSEKNLNNKLLDDIIADIERFINNKRLHRTKVLYKMTGKILRKDTSDKQIKTLLNFQEHSMGFVPVLVGERAYKNTDYVGLKAELPLKIDTNFDK